jgi:hypothetical protein
VDFPAAPNEDFACINITQPNFKLIKRDRSVLTAKLNAPPLISHLGPWVSHTNYTVVAATDSLGKLRQQVAYLRQRPFHRQFPRRYIRRAIKEVGT